MARRGNRGSVAGFGGVRVVDTSSRTGSDGEVDAAHRGDTPCLPSDVAASEHPPRNLVGNRGRVVQPVGDTVTVGRDVAAASAVVNGNNIFLRIEDGAGEVLALKEVSLRELLTKERMDDVAELPGRIGARKLVLGLDAGKKPPR